MEITWNPWHGCHKKSEGCLHCYMFRIDEKHERDSSIVEKTKNFYLPIKRNRKKEYKIESNTIIYTCFTSDFFVEEADEWRKEAWQIIRERRDCQFLFFTKRPERFYINLPSDWGEGYDNVTMGVSCESQKRADERLPILVNLPLKHKIIGIAPMLEQINIEPYLSSQIELVNCDGESGMEARVLYYDWVLEVREQCKKKDVNFRFRQTGANFIKDGKYYRIPKNRQLEQARKADIDYFNTKENSLYKNHI